MTFITDFVVEEWLRDITTDVWMSLHFDNPDLAGAYASEVFGGAYVRIPGVFTTPDARAVWNSSALLWTGLPVVTLTHVGGWDSQINGNMKFFGPLPDPVKIQLGKSFTIQPLDLAISID